MIVRIAQQTSFRSRSAAMDGLRWKLQSAITLVVLQCAQQRATSGVRGNLLWSGLRL